ncbi:hypothetical protein Ahia01_000472500 [Argonauta hians]
MSNKEGQDEDRTSCEEEDPVIKGSVLSRYISRFRYGKPLSRTERENPKSGGKEFWWLDSYSEAASPRQHDTSPEELVKQLCLAERRPLEEETQERLTSMENYRNGGTDLLTEWRQRRMKTSRVTFKDISNPSVFADYREQAQVLPSMRPPSPPPQPLAAAASPSLSIDVSDDDSSYDPVISSEGLGSSPITGSSLEDVAFKPDFVQFLDSSKSKEFEDLDSYNSGIPFSQYWKDNLDNDLLYQWRVKRRIQLAREQAQNTLTHQGPRPSSRIRRIGSVNNEVDKANFVERLSELHGNSADWDSLPQNPPANILTNSGNSIDRLSELYGNSADRVNLQNSSEIFITNCSNSLSSIFAQTPDAEAGAGVGVVDQQRQEAVAAGSQLKVNAEVQTSEDFNISSATQTQTIPIASPHLNQCTSCSKTVPAHMHMQCDVVSCKKCTCKGSALRMVTTNANSEKPTYHEPTEYRKYLVAEKPHHCLEPTTTNTIMSPDVAHGHKQTSGKGKTSSKTNKKKGKVTRGPQRRSSSSCNSHLNDTLSESNEDLALNFHGSSEGLHSTGPLQESCEVLPTGPSGFLRPVDNGMTPQGSNASPGRLQGTSPIKQRDWVTTPDNQNLNQNQNANQNCYSTDNRNLPNISLAPRLQNSTEPTAVMVENKDLLREAEAGSIPYEDTCISVPLPPDEFYESDGADFPSDPLLLHLRKMRSNYQKRIRRIDRKLQNLPPPLQEMASFS